MRGCVCCGNGRHKKTRQRGNAVRVVLVLPNMAGAPSGARTRDTLIKSQVSFCLRSNVDGGKLSLGVRWGDVGIYPHGDVKAAMTRDVLHDARLGSGHQQPGDVCVSQIVEAVVLGQLELLPLHALPSPVMGFWCAWAYP